jgi:O-acetylserine/cysteine efflux transporter
MDWVTVLLVVGATLAWGVTWLLMKLGVARMNWVGFGFLRPWMGLPFIAAYAAGTGGLAFGSPSLVLAAISAGVGNAVVGTALFYYALSHGSMHETNILANTGPFWGVVASILVLGEPARPVTFAAGALVIAGTYFLVRYRDLRQHGRSLGAVLAALAAGVLWGFTGAVPTKYCMEGGMNPMAFQFLFTGAAAVCWSAAVLPGLLRRRIRFGGAAAWIAFGSAFLGLFAGWVLWLVALERADASLLSPLSGLTLLFAVLLGVLVLREKLTRRILIGGLLTVAGVALVSALG